MELEDRRDMFRKQAQQAEDNLMSCFCDFKTRAGIKDREKQVSWRSERNCNKEPKHKTQTREIL